MIIDLNPLFSGIKPFIEFDGIVNFSADDLQNTSIKKLSDIKVNGRIHKISDFSIDLTMEIKTNMTLEDSVTLEEIEYPINTKINKILSLDAEDDEWEEPPMSVSDTDETRKGGQQRSQIQTAREHSSIPRRPPLRTD